MRHIRYVVLWMGIAGQLAGSSYTSVRDGLWSDAQTWGGSGVPGLDDNATVKHFVTLDVNTSVGTSPSSTKLATGFAIRIVNRNSTTDRGALIVARSVTLRAHGDIRMESSNQGEFHAIFQMDAGSTLIFDSSLASDPGAPHYRIYTPDPANGTYRASLFRMIGSPNAPVRFKGETAGRQVVNGVAENHMLVEQRGSGSGAHGVMDVLVQWAEIEDCGWQAGGCLAHAPDGATYPTQFTLEHVTLRRTSGIKPQYPAQRNPGPAATFILRDVKTFDTTTDPMLPGYKDPRFKGSLYVATDKPLVSGARVIEDCYFDQGYGYMGHLAGFTIRNTVWNNHPPGAAGPATPEVAAAVLENNVFRAKEVSARRLLAPIVRDLYFYGDTKKAAPHNPHGMGLSIIGDALVDGFIFDYASDTADPNAIWGSHYPAENGPYSYRYTFRRMILLPVNNSLTSARVSGIGPNPSGGVTTGRRFPPHILEHNTLMYMGGPRSFAGTLYVSEFGCTPAGTIEKFQSNISWGVEPSSNFAWSTHTGDPRCAPGLSTANAVMPEGVTHNACPGCSTSVLPWWSGWQANHPDEILTNLGTVYNVAMTGVLPGTRDLPTSADPIFVDIRRNLKTWCDQKLGHPRGACSADDAMTFLASGPGSIGERISDLFAWVQEGFRPQNEAYRNAAHDGGDIGAVPMSVTGRTLRPERRRR